MYCTEEVLNFPRGISQWWTNIKSYCCLKKILIFCWTIKMKKLQFFIRMLAHRVSRNCYIRVFENVFNNFFDHRPVKSVLSCPQTRNRQLVNPILLTVIPQMLHTGVHGRGCSSIPPMAPCHLWIEKKERDANSKYNRYDNKLLSLNRFPLNGHTSGYIQSQKMEPICAI